MHLFFFVHAAELPILCGEVRFSINNINKFISLRYPNTAKADYKQIETVMVFTTATKFQRIINYVKIYTI